MGHSTGCIEFLYIHERELYEVLLAILKKRKKVIFHDDTMVELKRAKLDPTVTTTDKDDATNEVPEVQKVPRAKEIQSILSQTPTDVLSMIADTNLTTSHITQPNKPSKVPC